MDTLFLLLLIAFQIKHFVADYLLQPAWMVRGKDDLAHAGGYAHAALHGLGSAAIMLLFGLAALPLAVLAIADCVIHYAVDFAKARWSRSHPADIKSRTFWMAHGADQFLHQLTYAVMIFVILVFGRVG
ncbi:MAG TPA: DUF3307 domain-containing protein [Gammaproteobacteria bacterium]|nr:DUF3307 domain-containing protein [Gammaproteobacteria bacterium]